MIKQIAIMKVILLIIFSILLVSCLTDDPLKIPFQGYSPDILDDGWEIASPTDVGINEEALNDVYRYVHNDDNVWQIRSLLVFKDNKLVAESYMKDRNDRINLHPIWSCTKQVTGILAGIAADNGLISINDTLSDHLPEVSKHPEKSGITIENLLTMKSGINYNNDGYKGEDSKLAREEASNSLDLVLGLAMSTEPGTQFRYKNSDPHLISAILQKRTGTTMRDWAQEVLFDKIGVTRLEWRTYKDGITFGAFGILTSPREMGKIGQLVANNGIWNGEQIVSKNWLDKMTSIQVPPDETHNDVHIDNIAFGYMWWKDVARNVNFTWGHGGQYVIINKDKNLVVVITSERHTSGKFNLLVGSALNIYDRINGCCGE